MDYLQELIQGDVIVQIMANRHNAKQGMGAPGSQSARWGRREEAKDHSDKARREEDKSVTREELAQSQLPKIPENSKKSKK